MPVTGNPSTSDMKSGIGTGVSIKGRIISGEDLYIDGEVEGLIEALDSTITIGPRARLATSIKARKVIVSGSVRGSIEALESIELRASCKLLGDLVTARISIQDGAYFKGSISSARLESPSSAVEVEATEKRYSSLVDLKYSRGLDPSEEAEFESLFPKASSVNGQFDEPVLEVMSGKA